MFILFIGTFETIRYKNTTISLAISVVWPSLHIYATKQLHLFALQFGALLKFEYYCLVM
jgi:hypothetical protein